LILLSFFSSVIRLPIGRSLFPLAFSSHDFIALICLRNLVFLFSAARAARDAYSAPAPRHFSPFRFDVARRFPEPTSQISLIRDRQRDGR